MPQPALNQPVTQLAILRVRLSLSLRLNLVVPEILLQLVIPQSPEAPWKQNRVTLLSQGASVRAEMARVVKMNKLEVMEETLKLDQARTLQLAAFVPAKLIQLNPLALAPPNLTQTPPKRTPPT
jgi:hypothetical protein